MQIHDLKSDLLVDTWRLQVIPTRGVRGNRRAKIGYCRAMQTLKISWNWNLDIDLIPLWNFQLQEQATGVGN